MTRGRPIVAIIAAVYILAAVRAVIPGLCQTQRAAIENTRQVSCCGAETCAPDDPGGPSLREHAKPHPPCPLCFLSATPRETLQHVAIEREALAYKSAKPSSPNIPHLRVFPLSDLGRSPPAQLPS
ncbi:MAG: hypothetical protein RBU21_12830 [FCB group bacterium]|nr:hypothetical protein [FCB group bacterium]